MPDTKIAFQKQMCVKARCETARCGEAARSGTTSTNCAEVRGGTDRGSGGGIKKGWVGEGKRKGDTPRSSAHTARLLLLPQPRRAPHKAPLPGDRLRPRSLPRTAQLFFFFFSFFSFSFRWLPGQKGLDSFDQGPCQQTNQRATFGP